MNSDYPHKEVEEKSQEYWDQNKYFIQLKIRQKRSFMHYQCFLIQVANYIWDMSEIMLLGMSFQGLKD